jgi:DNA-binding PadR family transcriptional regulator
MERDTRGHRAVTVLDTRDCSRESSRVSSIRLYILDALAGEGEMHGHQLRQLAEKEHVDEWTDITVGALYGTLKRMAAEELIEVARTEREGSYPERQVWRITEAGRVSLAQLRVQGIREIVLRADPVDLAISRADLSRADHLPELLAARLSELRAMLEQNVAHNKLITQYLSPLEQYVMEHKHARLRAEIAWTQGLIEQLPDLLDHEQSRKDDR